MEVARLLHWAQQAEETATGGERRRAYRFTREVIGGLIASGYPLRLIAEELQISVGSVRRRAEPGGWLPARQVEEGAGLRRATLRHAEEDGALSGLHIGRQNATYYPAAQIIHALSFPAETFTRRRLSAS